MQRVHGEVVEAAVAVADDGGGAAPEGAVPAFLPDVRDRRERPCALSYDAARADAHRAAGANADCWATGSRCDSSGSGVTRDGDRILIDGVEVDRCGGRAVHPIHGLAMDLGTTTIVVRLLNLETGELVADTSFENPQRFGGAEVMSRIAYDTIIRASC